MNRHWLTGCLLLAALCNRVPQASGQVSLSDDFSETVLDPRWVPLGTGCAAPRVEAGEVVLSGSDGCAQNSTDIFLDPYRYRVGGDFDVSFDLRLVAFSPTSAVTALVAGIELQRVGGGSYAVVERYYNASSLACVPAHSNYKGWFQDSNNCSPSVSWAVASGATGSFRITRVGTTVTEYYSEGSGWSVLSVGTRAADSLEVVLYAGGTGGSGVPYDVRIDNFQISADLITAVADVGGVRQGLRLAPPAPNPSNAVSEIAYSIAERAAVRTEIIDVAGRVVRVIEDGILREPGSHQVFWDGRGSSGQVVNAGVYFARVVAGSRVATRSLIRLR